MQNKLKAHLGNWLLSKDSSKLKTTSNDDDKYYPKEENKFLWLKERGIHTVLDVGAHVGESAKIFKEILPGASIYCFEPIVGNFDNLKAAVANIKDVHCFNYGLGIKKEDVLISKNEFTPSSSILQMEKIHKDIFPFTEKETKETVKLSTLDLFWSEQDLKKNIVLKIDTQGFEKNVLLGAEKTLGLVSVIIVETSFIKLYKDQPLFSEIYSFLINKNFRYIGSWEQLFDVRNGLPIQQDAIFLNNESNIKE